MASRVGLKLTISGPRRPPGHAREEGEHRPLKTLFSRGTIASWRLFVMSLHPPLFAIPATGFEGPAEPISFTFALIIVAEGNLEPPFFFDFYPVRRQSEASGSRAWRLRFGAGSARRRAVSREARGRIRAFAVLTRGSDLHGHLLVALPPPRRGSTMHSGAAIALSGCSCRRLPWDGILRMPGQWAFWPSSGRGSLVLRLGRVSSPAAVLINL